MPQITSIRSRARALTKTQKLSAACCAGLGVATLAITATPSEAQTTTHEAPAVASAPVTIGNQPAKDVKASITDQMASSMLKAEAIAAKQQAADQAAKKLNAQKAQQAAQKAAQQRSTEQAASRSAERAPVRQAAPKSYANNLDGWIRQSLDIMADKGIPGSYNGVYRNIIRESSGNPMAINNWDINARNGIPSKGLLQVIDPTFRAYHVPGTSWNIYDPVANITAACNYAAHRYGSMDNVNSAY
ncbi:transglycosylase SLT domain-containing protein [Streptomyces chiangmaiensis]|uniref:Transglycosylase SLT domain-containing protein n=1 Tax=Streptomyces chiangmaiensis TaxID=766497 RepID=A0ABU7FPZ4_9ACTN|nr:transglycosylase SLT domain-containing protein [Streptomyces chiangmaiensis]MED7826015.1 transglycosylase SLT domain-containing protein [Streptomyces chiangmaiensis]